MLIGFFLRRTVTVAPCAGAFRAGLKADELFAAGVSAPAVDCAVDEAGN